MLDVIGHKTVWDRFVLAYTSGVLRVFCSGSFPYVIAPAFSTPAFSTPAFSAPPWWWWWWCGKVHAQAYELSALVQSCSAVRSIHETIYHSRKLLVFRWHQSSSGRRRSTGSGCGVISRDRSVWKSIDKFVTGFDGVPLRTAYVSPILRGHLFTLRHNRSPATNLRLSIIHFSSTMFKQSTLCLRKSSHLWALCNFVKS